VLKASEWLGFTKLTAQNIEADRRWETWMVAAQAGDRAAYETLLQGCIPFMDGADGIGGQGGIAAALASGTRPNQAGHNV
jgi:hypothetical protein